MWCVEGGAGPGISFELRDKGPLLVVVTLLGREGLL